MARTLSPGVRARRPVPPRLPTGIQPMLAVLSQELPTDLDQYGFEYKWDGVRALCYWDGRRLRLESRNQLEITHRYPELHVLADALGSRPAILDGEIVALDENDRPSFPLLQTRMHVNDPSSIRRLVDEIPVRYLVFDLLHLDGRPTMERSYLARRDMLEQLTLVGPSWQVPPAHIGEGEAMLQAARETGLEGIVAKHVDSVYQPGRRSPDWLKIKVVARQEFVVGGWVPEGGNNVGRVGSLLLGYYEPDARSPRRKVLRFAGGVGTGFNDRWHRTLTATLRPLTRAASPFVDPVPKAAALYVEPILVAEIEYRRWPVGGQVHQAAFKGLRTDKDPRKVVREDRMCEAAPSGAGGEA